MKKSIFNSVAAIFVAVTLACAAPMAAQAEEVPTPVPTETQSSQPATPDDTAAPEPSSSTPSEVTPEPEPSQPETVPIEEATPPDEPAPNPEPNPADAVAPTQEATPAPEAAPQPADPAAPWVGGSTLTFSADCIPQNEERTPLVFNYYRVAGEGIYPIILDGKTMVGDSGGYTIGEGTHVYSYTVQNLTNPDQFVVKGPFTFTVEICEIVITPQAPTQSGDTVTMPYVPGMTYVDETSGDPTEELTLKDGETRCVFAEPWDYYYVFPEGATTRWCFTYHAPVDPGGPAVVTPLAPVLNGNVLSHPSVEGVIYRDDRTDSAFTTIVLTDGERRCVSAVPASNSYTFPEGAENRWCFTYTAEPIVVTPVNPLAGLPACSDYALPQTEGVVYGQPLSVQDGNILTITIVATPAKGFTFGEGKPQVITFTARFDTSVCEEPGGGNGGNPGGNPGEGGGGGSGGGEGGNVPGDNQGNGGNHSQEILANNEDDLTVAGSDADQLAVTGADSAPISAIAGGLLFAGLALVWIARRRRAKSA